jgi:CPA2 family monovalent cation:H+ antiporter-2
LAFYDSKKCVLHPSQHPGLIAVTLAIVLLGKPLSAILVVLLLRQPRRVALSTGAALGQIGEFSFIMASLGVTLGLLPSEASSTLVAAAIGSIALNPIIYRLMPMLDAKSTTAPAREEALVTRS